jgi:uncharacterized protein YjiS (DUF1127 family)|tara:strand:- start:2056 stop:2292 length:237 start_codon:yes stop_codon:yes gene_type:complete
MEMANFLRKIVSKWRFNSKVRQTIKELRALTDAELNDIGIGRGDIVSIARGDSDMKLSSRIVYNDKVLPVNANMKGWV